MHSSRFLATALLLVSFQSSATTFAGATDRATLLAVYQLSVENDAQLSAARHAFQASREGVPQARAGLLPNLSGGVTSEKTRLDRGKPDLVRERSGMVFQARLNQPLFRLDRWYQLKAAESTADQAELDLAAQQQELILNAAKAYFETLKALDQLSASQAEEAALDGQKAQAEARSAAGVLSITDVLDAQAAFDMAYANRKLAEQKVKAAYEAIYRLTQVAFSAIDGMDHGLAVAAPKPLNSDAWTELASAQNLRLQASAQAVAAAEHNYSRSRAAHLPTLDAVASYRKGDNDSFGYSTQTDFGMSQYQRNVAQSSVGLELNIPIYSGGLVSSQARESSERLFQRRDEFEDARREIVQRTRDAFRAVTSNVVQVAARRQAIRSSEESLKANRIGFDLGTRDIGDVLDAQRRLYAAVRDYNDARYDYILETLTLKLNAGTLSPADLQALSAFSKQGYDPSRDFLPPGTGPLKASGK
jgi:outer membrane protein